MSLPFNKIFIRGFVSGFAPFTFLVAPSQASAPPQVSMSTAWQQTGQALRSAISRYEADMADEDSENDQ